MPEWPSKNAKMITGRNARRANLWGTNRGRKVAKNGSKGRTISEVGSTDFGAREMTRIIPIHFPRAMVVRVHQFVRQYPSYFGQGEASILADEDLVVLRVETT